MLSNRMILTLYFLGVVGLFPINVGAFSGIRDALDQASSKLKNTKNRTVEFIHDQSTYNDGPIREALAPVVERLEKYRIEKIRSIEEARRNNPILANEMELAEANKSKSCMELRLEASLQDRLFRNCQLDSIYKICHSANSRVNSLLKSVASIGSDNSRSSTAKGLYELEVKLLNRLKSIRIANTSCSVAFRDGLEGTTCKDTYPIFFEDMEQQLMNSCEASLVLGRVESFITDMRDFDYGVQRKIQKIVDLHAKSRAIEVNLAVTLQEINASRMLS